MQTVITLDGYPVRKNERYWLIVTGKEHPVEVICSSILYGDRVSVKEYDEEMGASFPEEYLAARNTDITKQYEYAKKTAQRRYYQLIKHYEERIKTLQDLVDFPLRLNIHKNDAALSVYESKIKEFKDIINKNTI